MRRTLSLTLISCVAFNAVVFAEAPSALDRTILDVERRWSGITHVSQDDVVAAAARGDAVLFDVRTPEEYAVSHIAGATRIDPDISAQSFMAQHAGALKGKTAVFYCSVGVRSSKVAVRVASHLKAAGATGSVNLKGGIFGWANASRPLVGPQGPADQVHGYDASWSKLIEDPKRRATHAP